MSELSAADELPHAVGPELSWREAYAFELFDAASEIGGSARIEVRPNEGAMHVALDFFLGDGGFISARHVAARAENTARLEVEGVRFEMLEPLRRWRVSHDGPAHSLGSVADAGKREAWLKSRLERLIVDLEFTAVHPPIPGTSGFAQVGRWTGEVWVSGDRYAIDTQGFRDKNWGPARLPRMERRFALHFGDDCALQLTTTALDDGTEVQGWILDGGRTVRVRGAELTTETVADSYLQKAYRLTLLDADGSRHEVAGEMLHLAPLPDFRSGRELMRCTGFARIVYDGRSGFGMTEYLHQFDADGRPIEPVV